MKQVDFITGIPIRYLLRNGIDNHDEHVEHVPTPDDAIPAEVANVLRVHCVLRELEVWQQYQAVTEELIEWSFPEL